ncbi:hypothetical protein COLO4_06129 [Corchorus olitorius]|uniref:Uncharacterized protein n=1 Tax=Corchorus olitorius TaxID=93759 RepID=A0A1R3KNV1_9ROSI|nr:hypothetical protein COLO4_06129 [Corchorus olitorius]
MSMSWQPRSLRGLDQQESQLRSCSRISRKD